MIPDQTVRDGVITMQIIEGELTAIEITGNRWFRTNYLRQRLALDLEPPQHRALAAAPAGSYSRTAHRAPRCGTRPWRAARRKRPAPAGRGQSLQVALAFNNYQSPTVGAEIGLVTLAHQNLTGHGDVFSATYGARRVSTCKSTPVTRSRSRRVT